MATLLAYTIHALRSGLKWVFPQSRHSFLVDRTPYQLPVPLVKHATVNEDELAGRKLLVVGDVHGCYDELVELLDICNGRSPDVCVVFVGDLINKGPKSAEVVKLVREMNAYSVRGNHDECSLYTWQCYQEGKEPLPPKFEWMRQLSKEDLEWLSQLPYTLRFPSRKILVVHAGLVPGVELENQSLHNLLHMRYVSFNNKTLRFFGHDDPNEDTQPWAETWDGLYHVYFGHNARQFFQDRRKATGLDTACVYGGSLTAVFPGEGNRKVEVKSHGSCK